MINNEIIFSDGKGNVRLANGNTYNQFTGKPIHTHKPHKKYRATTVIIKDRKLLLVMDKGCKDFSMPGGGYKKGESTIQASIREVTKEELGGLTVISAIRLRQCDFEGQRAIHKVCQLIVEGEPYIKQKDELDKIVWWDMKSELPIQGHVKYIINKIKIQ
jgi:hypothetical protein